jgi:Transmembrane exosortase (Exosortase_EpsH)
LSAVILDTPTYNTEKRHRKFYYPRRNIFIWAAAIIFFNQLIGVMNELSSASFGNIVSQLCAVGIFQYMAWYAIFRLLGSSDPRRLAGWQDVLIVTALCLLVFLPTSRTIWVAATGIAVYLCLFYYGDLKLRAAGTVLAALSVQELWGHVFYNLVAFHLLRAEAAVVGAMLEFSRPGTVWQDNVITGPSGFGIVIYTGCSSFHNVSVALLCWVTISRLRDQNWRARDFVMGGVIGASMVLLNLARLYLMGWNIDLYNWWHHGFGADIFGVGASLTILLLSLYGSRVSERQL